MARRRGTPYDPASYRKPVDRRYSEAEKGQAIIRCREAGFDPTIPGNWERFTDDAIARRTTGKPPKPGPKPDAPRTFSSETREPWCDRSIERVDRVRKDAARDCATARGHARW